MASGEMDTAAFTAFLTTACQNLAAFSQALTMFTPFVGAPTTPQANPTPTPDKAPANTDLEELKKQLSDVQKRLDSLANKP